MSCTTRQGPTLRDVLVAQIRFNAEFHKEAGLALSRLASLYEDGSEEYLDDPAMASVGAFPNWQEALANVDQETNRLKRLIGTQHSPLEWELSKIANPGFEPYNEWPDLHPEIDEDGYYRVIDEWEFIVSKAAKLGLT